jgi:hypothetical protein
VEEERTEEDHSMAVSTGLDSDPKYWLTAAVYLRPSTLWNVRRGRLIAGWLLKFQESLPVTN